MELLRVLEYFYNQALRLATHEQQLLGTILATMSSTVLWNLQFNEVMGVQGKLTVLHIEKHLEKILKGNKGK